MKDNQREMTEFFESYAVQEDAEIEDELEQLADELGKESEKELPSPKKEEVKPIVQPEKPVKNDKQKELEDFLY
jgi:hypothetical protein